MDITEYEPSLPIFQHCPKSDALPFKEKKKKREKERKKDSNYVIIGVYHMFVSLAFQFCS